jgi:hypothetical protein
LANPSNLALTITVIGFEGEIQPVDVTICVFFMELNFNAFPFPPFPSTNTNQPFHAPHGSILHDP